MPIIKARPKQEKEQVRISIDKSVLENIRAYCDWATINKIDDFFEQCADYVLSKDKEWVRHGSNIRLTAESAVEKVST